MNAIETHKLCKSYKDTDAVNGLDLMVKQGELFSLLGVNGAGKTTTIKMLSCLTKPTSGEAYIMGKSVDSDAEEIKKLINVSPQETAVAPNLTVRENLEFVCGIYGFDKTTARRKAAEMIEEFKLTEIEGKRAKTLSGGWQRRLSIAMALISEPQILFLDEPTLGLDVLARRELWSIIEKLKGKITVILTTHYLEEAEALSDTIAVMAKGSLVAMGSAQELKDKAGCTDFEDAFVKLCSGGVQI